MLLDLGLSFVYAIILSHVFDMPLSQKVFIFSAIFSLLPDIDTPIELIQRGRLGGKESGFHREYTHYPILYVPLAIILWIYFGIFWAILLCVNILSHFIHDSIYTGWGLKWLWPFSKNTFKLFSNSQGNFANKFVHSWAPEDLRKIMSSHGDDDWFKNQYLRLSPILVIEVMIFVIGAIILVITLN